MRFLILAAVLTALTAHSDARQPVPAPVPRAKVAPKQKTDLELIQGTWTIVGLEAGGKAAADKHYRGNTFTFARVKGADTATLRERAFEPIEFAYKLDPAATPKAIDLTLPARGVTFRGIYKLDGNDLTICISNGGPQPTEFTTRGGGDTETFTLKRGQWERYADNREFGFGVDMPGKPEERRREIDTPAGKAATTLLVVRSEMERLTYVVSVTRLPGKLDAKETEAAKEAAKRVTLAEVYPNAKVAQEDRPKPPPKAAGIAVQELTLTLDLPDSKDRAAARVRLFVAGDRLYALMVAGAEEDTRSPNVSQFWNSFRQPADKKKN
jgi:uncharacterized protein (TIGR03067 family)